MARVRLQPWITATPSSTLTCPLKLITTSADTTRLCRLNVIHRLSEARHLLNEAAVFFPAHVAIVACLLESEQLANLCRRVDQVSIERRRTALCMRDSRVVHISPANPLSAAVCTGPRA